MYGHNSNSLAPIDYTQEATYRATRGPVERAMTLIPDAYREQAFYDLEQQRVFSRGWVCVGYTSQVALPGQTLLTDVSGQPLIIVRDKSGVLRGFYNVCRHRGSRLLVEDLQSDVIRCPYHAWGYGLDGTLLGTPYFDGMDLSEEEKSLCDTSDVKEFSKTDYPLLQVAVDSWGCFVFVNLAENPRPLNDWLGDLPERYQHYPLEEMRLVKRKHYTIEANWKLVAENFTEYYHLPWVHPDLSTVSRVQDHHRYQGPGMYTSFCTSPLTENLNLVDLELPPLESLDERERQSAYFVLLFPNLCLFLLPHHVFCLLCKPDGIMRTLETGDMLAHPSTLNLPDAERKLAGMFDFWDKVNQEDIGIIQRVQQGLAVRAYHGGRMCFRFEEPVHRFQNMVINRMTGNERIPEGD